LLPLDAFSVLDYIPLHLIPLRGVSWDAWKGGVRRWRLRARGRRCLAHSGGPGWPSDPTKGSALSGWTRTAKGGEIPPEWLLRGRTCWPGSTALEPKIATVERRKAFPRPLLPMRRDHAAATTQVAPFGAPPPSFREAPGSDLHAKHFAGNAQACPGAAACRDQSPEESEAWQGRRCGTRHF
jgi:hypothetical protein